ncbi:InlB B-repeat-containing protein [Bifidobacterium sp. W8120]|uniref:RCC1 domain-containing protein n=1 Tax=Bifidobacterium sp. W8120 TaxID=2750998 RepID=UPI0018DC9A13|nr:InlB B-repeat-containing protein [Bifidobacterium sp. W8120]
MRFDPADGSKPTQSTVKTGTLATTPQQNPVRDGFLFDGWTYDGQSFDFQTPILQDTTLKAQWTKVTDWTLSPNHGPASGTHLTISPPDRQEPYYTSIQSAGNQIVGLTGDGRIYTWTQDTAPKQDLSPAQAADGFHYLQVAAGSHRQAALGSDQQIYTWAWGQATPTILDPGRSTQFTSISMNDDRLLAVDRQGQIHHYQASQDPKLAEQATTSLPGKAQAVTAVSSGGRILALDSDGQAWTRDASNTGNAKPERLTQNPHTRIIQAQALNQGALLLDADGQAWYQADSTADSAAVSLPEGMKASRITVNKNQATIVGEEGRIWAWQPGSKTTRADNGSQQYMQATKTGSRITTINRQGSMFTWSLDGQGQPSKPTKLETATAPILETANLDGQPLKLSRKNSSWQTETPARKPGSAVITITGRQDGQPFTRSLKYMVDQPLTRGAEPRSTLTVRFDTGGGKPEPADQQFTTPYGRVKRPSPDPARDGFLFDGWFTGEVAYDFSRPVSKDLTLSAHWSPAGRNSTWSISPDKGSQLGRESTTITPPDSASRGIRFSQISGSQEGGSGGSFSLAVGSDGNAYAWGANSNGQLGDGTTGGYRSTPVMVKMPDRNTYPDLPKDFTYLQVSAGTNHSLAVGSDGNAYAWGYNYYGQLGDGTSTTDRHAPVRVKTPDRKTYPDLPKDFTYVQVSAGEWYSLAMGSDGNAYAWGYNYYGQLGDGTSSYSQATPVRVKTPDRKTYPDLPKDFTYVQVSAGGYYSLAMGSDGNAYAWGNNNNGQLGDGTTSASQTTPVRVKTPDRNTYPDLPKDFTYMQVSAGYDHSLAVGSDGYAYAWGWNYYGQLGNNTSSGYSFVPVRVRNPANPTDTSKGLQATQVSGGYDHSLAVGSNGNAYAWGWNSYGQLGNDSIPTGQYNSNSQSPVPVPVSFNLQLVITGVRFDQTSVSGLTRGDGSSVTVFTPAHQPGMVTVSVDYTLGGAPQTPDTSLRYTYLPAGVLPQAGGEGILLALATGMTGMGGVLASRRHRREQHQLSHASLE